MLSIFRWYYNYALTIWTKIKDDKEELKKVTNYSGQLSYQKFRTYISNNWTYRENRQLGDFVIDDDPIIPDYDSVIKTATKGWPRDKKYYPDYHNRIPRGSIKNLTGNLNACISNLKAGNIRGFKLKYRLEADFLLVEDKNMNAFFKKVKGTRTEKGRKQSLTNELLRRENAIKQKGMGIDDTKETCDQGLSLVYNQSKGRFDLFLPTNVQGISSRATDTIALDTGVRTFQTGYSPQGHTLEIGKQAQQRLIGLLEKADRHDKQYRYTGYNKYRKRKLLAYNKITNLVDELHWKSIAYLVSNYKTIYLPDFRIMGMVKGKKLPRMVKRLLYLYSYSKFKSRLLWKASLAGVEVKVVDESYTSKTCSNCGHIHTTLGANKVFRCSNCGLVADRDINAARNIYIKNSE